MINQYIIIFDIIYNLFVHVGELDRLQSNLNPDTEISDSGNLISTS